MNIAQLLTPVVAAPSKARKVSPEKLLAKAKAKPTKKPVEVVTELSALRTELQALTGAPVSPIMTIEQLKAKIEAVKNPVPEVEEPEEIEVVEKVRVIPAKAQGIGAYCVAELKAGGKPKDVLASALAKFPEAKTSMACVYWYASKIKQGLL
jgi:hypothetical protein